jgi:hypothetical protein
MYQPMHTFFNIFDGTLNRGHQNANLVQWFWAGLPLAIQILNS